MAKVPFTKLKCKLNIEEIPVQIGEETIAVKQYLPIQEKLALIGRVVELAHMQDENYSNPVKAAVFRDLEICEAYTNINFTDKQKEDPSKLYDILYSSNVLSVILNSIPKEEYNSIVKGVEDTIESVYKYQNSILGILDTLKTDYSNLDFDITDLSSKLTNIDNLDMVKNILTNLN
jgi:hypothetical protein